MTGDTRKRTFGLAAILVVGTIAGFLAAAGTSGAQYATVGTVAESQAFQMPVEDEDQRVRFALEADKQTATEPSASFALYDPGDEFFTEFELSGEGDDAEAILDEAGPWVLFVTERRNAELAVQYETEDEESLELEELDVSEERTVVAEQDGGSLDEQVVFRLSQRPASAFLSFDGDIEGLDATVATDEGPVYELSDASVNSSEDGSRTGQIDVTSANLAAGTYDVEATADSFDGELAFVHQTYERAEVQTQERERSEEAQAPEEENVTSYTDEHEGAVVAEIAEGEAFEVHTVQAEEIAFLAREDSEASLRIYNQSDRVVDQVEIDAENQDSYDWSEGQENESEANETRSEEPAATVELPGEGSFVVYAEHVYPEEQAIQAFVPDEAAEADELDVETREATLEGQQDAWNATLDGALLEISAHTSDAATTDRNVTATGEAGTLLHYEQAFNTFGAAVHSTHEEHPENFTDGDLEVTMDADGFGGQTNIELAHYVR
jgi:hypothetical protein